MPAAFREHLLPLASIITPNQFEAELLSGMTICSEDDAVRVCAHLQAQGPHTVIITSLALAGAEESVTIIASTTRPQTNGSSNVLKLCVPRVHAYFTGTGKSAEHALPTECRCMNKE